MVSISAAARLARDQPGAPHVADGHGPVRRRCSGRRVEPRVAGRRRVRRATSRSSLHKGIPSGAGLGGGSADAAAVLVALRGDPAIAATLGADVPFCLRGGFAHGPRHRRAASTPGAMPDARRSSSRRRRSRCATADVYRAWDELGGPQRRRSTICGPRREHVEPRLVEFRRQVEAAAEAPAILAGSGSSYAVVFERHRATRSAPAPGSRPRSTARSGSARRCRSACRRSVTRRRDAKRPPRWGGRCLLALLATLPAGLLQQLLVLLLAHALAALLDQ